VAVLAGAVGLLLLAIGYVVGYVVAMNQAADNARRARAEESKP
jgi:hypothetical protein